jgi:hypothetical protein
MNTLHASTVLSLALAISTPALAQQSGHRLGDHPAVVVQRLYAQQGYDYASKFYPHPAWLYLLAEEPHRMVEHPAVLVFQREQQRLQALAEAAPRKLVLTSEQR